MAETITTGDGCRIAYRFDGTEDGPVLLLSNSLGTSMAMWEPQMAAFASRCRVLRYDSRGHGASDAPVGAYSMDRLGRDVLELLDALGLETVDFCGLSLGGMVGQWLGIRAPHRLRRLILANTSAYMGPPAGWDSRIAMVRGDGMAKLADASIARWFTPDFPAGHAKAVEPIRQMLLATDPAGYIGCCAAIRDMDMRRLAQLIAIPTLLIGGSQDPATPVEDSAYLLRQLKSADLVTLSGAHLSNVECPTAFAEACLEFLK
jgi:3-oxoadipate enol-lactonase